MMRDNSSCKTMCDLVEKWKQFDMKMRVKGAFLMWSIWGKRNNKIFNETTTPNHVLQNRVEKLAEEYGKYSKGIYHRPMATAPSARV